MRIGRNDPCPCGSGKKYKKCCENAQRPPIGSQSTGHRLNIGDQLRAAENLFQVGQYANAAEACHQILMCSPRHSGAFCLLGKIQLLGSDSRQAVESFKAAIKVTPNNAQLLYYCGRALAESGQFIEATPYLEKAVKLDPGFAEGHNFLGTLLHVMGRTDKAAALTLKAVHLDRNNPQLHSHQLVSAHSSTLYSAADLFGFHMEWASRHANRFYSQPPHTNSPDPQRKIKLGYVSPRFSRDIVGYFFKPVFDQHSRENFELFCYSNARAQDDYTNYFSRNCTWRNIANLSDEEAAKRIRQDGIDILVDLAGHTPNNRLLVFARKPAPVQVTWLDYFDTTGLKTMDYLITDPVSTPEDGTQRFAENLICMPHVRLCWSPPEFAPDVCAPPVLTHGFVTFGSFNRPEKMTGNVIRLWARILREIPDSRLVLKNRNFNLEDTRSYFLKEFNRGGIASNRIEFRGESPHEELLREYGDVDIALDTFPYNGGATTCDSLLMGVPVITLKGSRIISRQTMSILSSAGLTEFIASDEEGYLRIAIEWSGNTSLLAEKRDQLRKRFVSSPVCDSKNFTADLERIYHKIWKTWCAKHNTAPC